MWYSSTPHQRENMPSLHFSSPPECGPASSPVLLAKEAGTKDHSWGQGSTNSHAAHGSLPSQPIGGLSPSAPTLASFANKEWGEVSRMCSIPFLPPPQSPAFWAILSGEHRTAGPCAQPSCSPPSGNCGPALCLQLPPAYCVAGNLVLRCAPWFHSSPTVAADPVDRASLFEAGPGVHVCAEGPQSLRHEMGKVSGPPAARPSPADHEAITRVLRGRVGWGHQGSRRSNLPLGSGSLSSQWQTDYLE